MGRVTGTPGNLDFVARVFELSGSEDPDQYGKVDNKKGLDPEGVPKLWSCTKGKVALKGNTNTRRKSMVN